VAWFLIGLGVILIVFTFLLAFTVYGEVAGLLGVLSLACGMWMLARGQSQRTSSS
jgi:cadmium resistance protein CadD (predicted permease)